MSAIILDAKVRAGLLEVFPDHFTEDLDELIQAAKTCDKSLNILLDRKVEDMGMDSLDMIELVMAAEQELNVSLAEEIEEELVNSSTLRVFAEKVNEVYLRSQ